MKNILSFFFVPQKDNDWKGRLLHHDFLTVLIFGLLILNISFKFIIGNVPTNILGINTNLSTEELLNDTNTERIKYGLKPLTLNKDLTTAAKGKATNMFEKNYWAHFSPDGTSPWYFFDKAQYKYIYAGENLAKDFATSQAVINAWMNSEKHRENLLKPEYTQIGFAISEGQLLGQQTTLVVQFFGTPDTTIGSDVRASNIKPPTSPIASVGQKVQSEQIKKTYLVDAGLLQKRIVFIVLAFLIIALSIDLYVIEQNTVLRLSGKHLAHLVLVLFFIVGMLVIKPGLIL